MKKSFYFIFIILILFIACGKTLPYDDSDGERQIVVNAIINNTECKVFITKSTRLSELDTTFYLQGATVQVTYANGQTDVLIPHDTIMGFYSFPIQNLQAGTTLSITVSHPDYNTATSNIIIPSKAVCRITDTVWQKYDEFSFPSLKFISVEIDDNPLEENYYMFEVYESSSYLTRNYYYDSVSQYMRDTIERERYKNSFSILPLDMSIEVVSDGYDMFALANTDYTFSDNIIQPYKILITDKNWNGTRHKETVEILYPNFGSGTVYLVAKITAINKEFYEFAKSMAAYAYKQEYMGEPIQIATNIKGGLGYFTSQLESVDSVFIQLQDTSFLYRQW